MGRCGGWAGAAAAATAIVAEIGGDMGRCPSAKHPASWAGLCPGNRQGGGQRLSGRATTGNVWLEAALGEVAWSTTHTTGTHTTGTYLAALYHRLVPSPGTIAWYHRLARRRGKHKAIVAVAHSLLVSIYHMLRDHQPYHELGPDHFDRLDTARIQRRYIQRRYIQRLEQLGYAVPLTPAGAA